MDVYEEFENIVFALESEGIEYAVCGGIAVLIYGYERLTKDIDILVRKEDLGRIKEVAAKQGFNIDSGEIPFGIGTPQRREVHRVTKIEGSNLLMLDLMVVPEFLEDVWEGRRKIDWKDKQLQVVSPEGLTKLKRMAGRLQDLADLSRLGWLEDEDEEES